MSCQQMRNQGNGDSSNTPLTDSLVSAIADGAGVSVDRVTVEYACDERRAMSLSISFSITLSVSDLESPAVTADAESAGQQLVTLLDLAVSSGSFATSVSVEAANRGEIVAVKATILESACLICDIEQVIINDNQGSESIYVGTVVLVLLVAVPLFFGELAIWVGFNTLRSSQPWSDSKQSSCEILEPCQTSHGHLETPMDTSKVSKEEWVTQYGSDAGFDLYDAGGDIASGRSSRMLSTPFCLFVRLFGVNTVWLLQTTCRSLLPSDSCKHLQCDMGNTNHRNAPTELCHDSMVLDLLVKTYEKTKNEAVEESSHRDVDFGSNSKLPVGVGSGVNSEDHATVFSTLTPLAR